MATSKREYKNTRRKTGQIFALLLIGAGLMIFAVVAAVFLADEGVSADSENAPQDLVIPASVNYHAPDLKLSDLRGSNVALTDYLGQVVLINNWATWCPPCRAEMPTLQAYYEEHKDQGFTIIAIDAGDLASDVSKFADEFGLTFPVWLDPNSDAIRAFRNNGLPSSYVLDRSGTVRLAWTGAISSNALEQYVTPLIKE